MHSSESARRPQHRRRSNINIAAAPPTTTTSSPVLTHKSSSQDVAAPSTPPPRRAPPISSKGKQAAANRAASNNINKVSAQTLKERDHRDAQGSAWDRSDRDRDMDSYINGISAPSPVDMSNKENNHPNGVDNDREPLRHARLRDSHDLSAPRDVTRDSLVANMLMSLDQFSFSQMNSGSQYEGSTGARTMTGYGEPSLQEDDGATRTMTSTLRPRGGSNGAGLGPGPGHGYSYSSDYDGNDDSSRYSSNLSRGRRSNSSSTGFQSSLGRINSMHEMTNQRSIPGTPGSRPLHSRGGRGSKSSSTNSVDAGYAQVLGSQRWVHGLGARRSSSLEFSRRQTFSAQPEQQTQNQQQYQQSQQQHGQQRPPWHIEFSNGFSNDEYDAAPTPTIPVGPRRLPAKPSLPAFPRPEPMAEPLSPVRSVNLERTRTSKSSRSVISTGRQTQSKFNARDAPPMPAGTMDLESAPSPHVGYEKAKEPVHAAAAAQTPAPLPKERPGFFKRMFGGSSKNSVVAAIDNSVNSTIKSNSSINPPSAGLTSSSSQHSASHVKSPVDPPSRDSQHQPPVLQKKPSSFFRRRKKSVSEPDHPPLPTTIAGPVFAPVQLLPAPPPRRADLLSPRDQPSPVGSLRKAMDPYLRAQSSSTGLAISSPLTDEITPGRRSEDEEDRPGEQNVRSFSPDYEPDPRATIRSVPSDARRRDSRTPAEDIPRMDTPTRDPPQPPHLHERAGSFLHDDSDDEESPKRGAETMSRDRRAASPSDAGRLMLAPVSKEKPLPSPSSTIRDKKVDRLVLDSPTGDNFERPSSLTLPIEGGMSDKTVTPRRSAASIPSVMVEDSEANSKIGTPIPLDEPEFVVGDPTEDDRSKAKRIFDGNEDFIQKEKAAAWMGEEGPVRQRTLRAYMDLYDFAGKNVVTSLRDVCNKLVFRAETQQVDRILVAFSARWCECNPNHGFKATGKLIFPPRGSNRVSLIADGGCTDVIHTICYSIMLLNTDLHLADIESKMTRSQFIKNTMTTIRQAIADFAPEELKNNRQSILPGRRGSDQDNMGGPAEHEKSTFRNSFIRMPARAGSSLGDAPTELDDSGPLVKAPFDGTLRSWEGQMEIVLKETYASIRDERLPLYGAEPAPEQTHHTGLFVLNSMLKRSPSVLSRAPSENPSSRGRVTESRTGNPRWTSKSRSRPRGFGTSGFSSSRTSFDDNQSMWSPVESSATWSRASLGRTQTSMSMDSFGSHFPRGEYKQSIGFANALSQAIIREDPMGSEPSLLSDELKATQILEDESLELAGAPWVKEGMVIHKHHLDGVDKKAKDRNWNEVFAVIQKGTLSIFSFAPNKSMGRAKGRTARQAENVKNGGVVGGGNWQDSATNLGTFSLRQTLASALPPPGYSKTRPHVWALSLPTGAVHLFQAGTPEINKEFVITANYWAARLSTHPLMGGISNVEYGWSDAIINNALVSAINETTGAVAAGTAGRQRSNSRPGSSAAVGRGSLHSRTSSFRSAASLDFGSSSGPRVGSRGDKLPGDRITVADWTPPTQSMRPSNSAEKEQLETLKTYVRGIEEDLQQHNALRSPMLLAFTPRGTNAAKAMANWEKKSAYLLREIVKFRTYVDCLQHADGRKQEIWKEREVAHKAARGESFDIDRGPEDHLSINIDGASDTDVDEGEGDATLRPRMSA